MKRTTTLKTIFFVALFSLSISFKGFSQDATLKNGSYTYDASTHGGTITIDICNDDANNDIPMASGWRVGFYFSSDATLNINTDVLINFVDGGYGMLSNNCNNGFNLSFDIDDYGIPSGNYYILVKTDDENKITETNETNNLVSMGPVNYTGGTSAPLPDAAPENGSFTYDATSHQLSVTLNICNKSATSISTNTGFRTGFYLSSDAILNNTDYFIASIDGASGLSGNTCSNGANVSIDIDGFTIPSGNYYILVKADDQAKITESNENNNLVNVGTVNYTGISTGIESSVNSNSLIILEQNFPNPFNSLTTFQLNLPEEGSVSLKVFDVTGKEVQTVVNQKLQKGAYQFDFKSNDLSGGVYYYTLSYNNDVVTKKMLLIKE